jgi:hypothetical protein
MARPKRHKTPARLNITLDAEVKNTVVLLAAEKGLSIGQLISQMVQGETSRASKRNRGNGQTLGDEEPSQRLRKGIRISGSSVQTN